jgi:hypothetical protein
VQLFERVTGVKKSDWYPHIWLRWGDALEEAGYARNELQKRIGDIELLERYIGLARELNHLPVEGELRRKAANDSSFPSHTSFSRFGGKKKLVETIARYCRDHPGFEDVAYIFASAAVPALADQSRTAHPKIVTGFVYLMRSGRHYKIGRTNAIGRRESELAIKIPVPPTTIHHIETDDPPGIEAYWHRRFGDKRGEGEWFDLSPDDVAAFKRWKRIV